MTNTPDTADTRTPPTLALNIRLPGADIVERAISMHGCCYQHRGRSATGRDWIGFIMAALVLPEATHDVAAPYRAGWDDGLTVPEATGIFLAWGLEAVSLAEARPGDIILFSMPRAHAAVLTAGAFGAAHGQIAHIYWGRAATASWLQPWWAERATLAFRRPR